MRLLVVHITPLESFPSGSGWSDSVFKGRQRGAPDRKDGHPGQLMHMHRSRLCARQQPKPAKFGTRKKPYGRDQTSILLILTLSESWRWPVLRREFLRRRNFCTVSLGPWTTPTTSACTLTPESNGNP